MGFTNKVVCEVRYQKNNTGKIRDEVGLLEESEIAHFFTTENNFIQFQGESRPLIPKHEIVEIIKYREQERFILNHEKLKLYNSTERRLSGKTCY